MTVFSSQQSYTDTQNRVGASTNQICSSLFALNFGFCIFEQWIRSSEWQFGKTHLLEKGIMWFGVTEKTAPGSSLFFITFNFTELFTFNRRKNWVINVLKKKEGIFKEKETDIMSKISIIFYFW